MGDSGFVCVLEDDRDSGVYLYTHWRGTELPGIVASAIRRSPDEWDDAPHLARIIFCEMVGEDTRGTRGFGIYSSDGYCNHPLIALHVDKQTVSVGEDQYSFKDFVNKHRGT